MSVVNFAYDLNVNGVHYPTDVIGGRVLGTYVIAQMLAGNPLYPSTIFNSDPATLTSLSTAMQTYLGGGASSPYAAACGGSVANTVACVTSGVIPTAATYTQQGQAYLQFMTYDLPAVGDTTPGAGGAVECLLADQDAVSLPDSTQLNEILYTTEVPSGGLLDNGSGWARLNLYAAAGGYGAFRSNVTVNMDADATRPERVRRVEQQHQRARRPDPDGLRNPDPGRQQHLHGRHQRAGHHDARPHRQSARPSVDLVRRHLRGRQHRHVHRRRDQ